MTLENCHLCKVQPGRHPECLICSPMFFEAATMAQFRGLVPSRLANCLLALHSFSCPTNWGREKFAALLMNDHSFICLGKSCDLPLKHNAGFGRLLLTGGNIRVQNDQALRPPFHSGSRDAASAFTPSNRLCANRHHHSYRQPAGWSHLPY